MTKSRDKKDTDNSSPKYIHLQNVEVWEIFSTEPFRFEYWRGKLSSIDGFSLGARISHQRVNSLVVPMMVQA